MPCQGPWRHRIFNCDKPWLLTLYAFDKGEIPLIQEVKARSAAIRLELKHGRLHKQGSFIILQCRAVQEDTHCSIGLTQHKKNIM